jgi:hypothetical protein
MAAFNRTKDNPLPLKTPPGTADFAMHSETKDGVPILVCTVGKTVLHYDARCIEELHAMLRAHGDWMELGGADESGNLAGFWSIRINQQWRVIFRWKDGLKHEVRIIDYH